MRKARADISDRLISIFRRLREALPAEVDQRFREVGTESGRRDDRRCAEDIGEDVRDPPAEEGRSAGQEREEDGAGAVDVGSGIDPAQEAWTDFVALNREMAATCPPIVDRKEPLAGRGAGP